MIDPIEAQDAYFRARVDVAEAMIEDLQGLITQEQRAVRDARRWLRVLEVSVLVYTGLVLVELVWS